MLDDIKSTNTLILDNAFISRIDNFYSIIKIDKTSIFNMIKNSLHLIEKDKFSENYWLPVPPTLDGVVFALTGIVPIQEGIVYDSYVVMPAFHLLSNNKKIMIPSYSKGIKNHARFSYFKVWEIDKYPNTPPKNTDIKYIIDSFIALPSKVIPRQHPVIMLQQKDITLEELIESVSYWNANFLSQT